MPTYFGLSMAPHPVNIDSSKTLYLSDQINASTRSIHSQLNRLIIDRLPLALPPYTIDSNIYLTGLLHIAPIYITFESLWQAIVNVPCPATERDIDLRSFSIAPVTGVMPELVHQQQSWARIRSILSHLQVPGLARSARLLADLRPAGHHSEPGLSGELGKVSEKGALAEFLIHIRLSVGRSPHVLVAFAWVLYTALFSGGRILRVSLKKLAGGVPGCGLQFFEFDGDEDGEDIRRVFKERFAEVETRLTRNEKEEIVLEAQEIFKFLIDIVFDLDEICKIGTGGQMIPEQHGTVTSVEGTKNQLDEQQRLMTQRELGRKKFNHYRIRSLEILGLMVAILAWYCYFFRWWRYPHSTLVAVAALEGPQSLE